MITIVLEESDKSLSEVLVLVEKLQQHSMDWRFINHPQHHSYRELEIQLENSSVAIIVIASGLCDSTWGNMCTQYCWALKKYRQSKSFDYVGLITEEYKGQNYPTKANFEENSQVLHLKVLFCYLSIDYS